MERHLLLRVPVTIFVALSHLDLYIIEVIHWGTLANIDYEVTEDEVPLVSLQEKSAWVIVIDLLQI